MLVSELLSVMKTNMDLMSGIEFIFRKQKWLTDFDSLSFLYSYRLFLTKEVKT